MIDMIKAGDRCSILYRVLKTEHWYSGLDAQMDGCR